MKANEQKEIARCVNLESPQANDVPAGSTILAAMTISRYTGLAGDRDLADLAVELSKQCERTHRGDLRRAEAMLAAQAHTLDAIFNRLASDAADTMRNQLTATELRLRLALKAQAQCRATLEALAAIKNPAVFARQANISHGPQQVNNQVATADSQQSTPRESAQIKLLDSEHGKRMDRRTTGATGCADPAVAAVGAIHRPSDKRRQKAGVK